MTESIVAGVVDSRPLSRLQITTVILSALILFVDGYDTQIISYAAPALAREWNLTQSTLGHIFSAGLAGGMIGYMLLAPFSDSVGHKRMIVAGTILFGVFTMLTARTKSADELIAIRFVTGLALGVTAPSVIALVGEYSPARYRATAILAVYCGFSLGFVAAGAVSVPLLNNFGWQSLFWVGAAAPLLLAPFVVLRLPESIEFLMLNGLTDRARKIVSNIDAKAPLPPLAGRGHAREKVPLLALFRDGRYKETSLIWLMFFFNAGSFYLLQSWLPMMLTTAHRSLDVVASATAISTVGGISAAFVIGPFMDRLDRNRTLALLYLLGAVGLALLGIALEAPLVALLIVSFWAGACVSGGQKGAIALATLHYPAMLRGTGLGWALGIGRIGGVVGSFAAGTVLSLGVTAPWLFGCLSLSILMCSLLSYRLSLDGSTLSTVTAP
jgi:AAHS family 4-hydroxybenzoate transporter-like MFS transporter